MMIALCLTTAVFAQSPCDPPTNVNVVPGTTSATVSWTGSAEQYNVQYFDVTFYCGADGDCIIDWLIYDVDGDGYNWGLAYPGLSGAEDDVAFYSASYNGGALNPDNWLITPLIDLGGTMSVWMMSYLSSYPDTFAIYLTTDPNWSSADNLTDVFNITLVDTTRAPSTYTEYTADLSAYAGQQGYIAIRHFNSYDQYRLYMDDFRVGEWTMMPNASSPWEISDLPSASPLQVQVQAVCSDGTSEWTDPVNTATHGLCDDPSGLVASNVTGNTATLEWTGYQENYNVRYMSGEIDTLFFEDFENGRPDTWTTIDNDGDGYNWFDFDCTGYVGQAHSGTGIVNSESYINGYGALTPDNWLITPQIELNGIMRVWLRGMETGSNASEHFAIYLSTTNNSVDDFTITLVPEAVATAEYVEYTADLSAYAGQQGYIAIRHFNVTDKYRLNVDDFGVFVEPWTTETASGNSTELTGLDPETTYIAQVQGVCEDGVTEWSDYFQFTTAETEPCTAPTNLYADFNGTSGTFGWTDDNNANYYQLEMDILDESEGVWSNTMSNSGLLPNPSTYSFDFSSGKTYRFRVKTKCSDENWSEFSENFVFTVPEATDPCAAPTNLDVSDITATSATVSWTGSAEQYNVRYLNNTFYCGADDYNCVDAWTKLDIDGDGYGWEILNNAGRDGNAFLSRSYYYDALNPDNWLITPLIDLGGTMSVWMKSNSNSYIDTFAIYLTTDPNWSSADNLTDVFTDTLVPKNGAPSTYTKFTADLSAYAGQQGYIAIRHFDSYDQHILFMDDFRVGEWTMMPNASSPLEISDLDPLSPYQVQVQAVCSDGESEWTDPVEFTTEPACEISLIEIEGFTAPEWGANPDYEVNVPADANYQLYTWGWIYNSGSILSETETFINENANYGMVLEVIPNGGCVFADDVTFTINGDASIVEPHYYILHSNYCEFYSIGFTVEKPYCPVPTGIEVSDITSNSASVSWDPSDAENYDLRYYVALDELENESWKYYDNDNNINGIGTNGGNFWWGVMFPGSSYSTSPTANVLHVQAYDYMSMNGTVTLYNDGDNAPATPVGSTEVTFTGSNQFVEFTFDEPVAIDPSKNLWVVFYNASGANIPAAVCENTGDPNGRWISLNGSTWGDLYEDYGFNYTFMIRAGILNVDVYELSWTKIDGIGDNTSALTGLAANTDYKVQVRATCGYSGSAWSEPVEFTTTEEPAACAAPTNLTATNITENSATLSWTGNNDSEEWFLDLYEYNESTGGWTTIGWYNYLTSNSLTISVAPGTIYGYRVRSRCIDENWSEFSDFYEFTTMEETEPCVISEINIEGFTAPVWGAHPDLEVNVPEDANYTLEEWYWSDYHNHLLPEETFDNNNYYMFFHVLPNEGCIIAYDATITINNNSELVDDDYSTIVHEFCTFYSIEYDFTETPVEPEEPCEISTIEIEGFTAPAWGAHPDLEVNVPEDAHYSLAYKFWKWYDAETHDGYFLTAEETFDNENYTYYMIFKINPNGCTISNDVTITINGDASLVNYNANYNWNELSNEGRFYSINFEIEKPTEEPIEPGECGLAEDCEGTSYPTVRIGDLCWMQKNLAAVSCVTSGNVYAYVSDQFPDEDANTAAYGLLYDEEAVMQGIGSGAKAASDPDGICPSGYRLPTVAEIETLGAAYTADELKSTNYWITGGGGSDISGFGWLPGGCYNDNTGRFERMTTEGYLWATETVNGEVQPAMYKITYYCSTILIRVEDYQGLSASVRCVKEAGEEPAEFTCGDNLFIGENSYPTVQIGTQCWTKTNLREAVGTTGTESSNYSLTNPCYYVHPTSDANLYGYYYNWPAANMACPKGWHLPSLTECNEMLDYVRSQSAFTCGGDPDNISKALASNYVIWTQTSDDICSIVYDQTDNNATGFSAIPAGYSWVYPGGTTVIVGQSNGSMAQFWLSTEAGDNTAYLFALRSENSVSVPETRGRSIGSSVRCVKN